MTRQPKAKTAYELLQRVCEHIKEEPKRYDQNVFACVGKERTKAAYGGNAPSCGTVACRAGWIVALHDGTRRLDYINRKSLNGSTEDRAREILDVDDVGNLFNWGAVDVDIGTQGTREYALAGVRGLRAFMKQHAKHLKARSLKGV